MARLDWFLVAIMALAWVSISFFPSWWAAIRSATVTCRT